MEKKSPPNEEKGRKIERIRRKKKYMSQNLAMYENIFPYFLGNPLRYREEIEKHGTLVCTWETCIIRTMGKSCNREEKVL